MVKFEVYNDGEYWCARGIGVDIFTHGKTLDELMDNIKEAVEVSICDRALNYAFHDDDRRRMFFNTAEQVR